MILRQSRKDYWRYSILNTPVVIYKQFYLTLHFKNVPTGFCEVIVTRLILVEYHVYWNLQLAKLDTFRIS